MRTRLLAWAARQYAVGLDVCPGALDQFSYRRDALDDCLRAGDAASQYRDDDTDPRRSVCATVIKTGLATHMRRCLRHILANARARPTSCICGPAATRRARALVFSSALCCTFVMRFLAHACWASIRATKPAGPEWTLGLCCAHNARHAAVLTLGRLMRTWLLVLCVSLSITAAHRSLVYSR